MNELKNGIDAIEFLRAALNMLNMRDENLNENKTPQQLLREAFNAMNDKTENETKIFYFWNGKKPNN